MKADPKFPAWRETWMRVFRLLEPQSPGYFIGYAELEQLTQSGRMRAQAALRRARMELQRTRNRWLVCEPDKGYRMIEAREHAGEAVRYQKQARRKITTGIAVTIHVNTDELTDPRDRKRHEQVQSVLVLARGFLDQLTRLKQLPPRSELRLPSNGDLLRVIDGTRRKPPNGDATTKSA